MLVKTLLKTLRNVDFTLQSVDGWMIYEGFVGDKYYESDDGGYGNMKIKTITTVANCDRLYITIYYA